MTLVPLLAITEWMTVDPSDTTLFHVACLVLLVVVAGLTYTFHRLVRSELFFLTLDAVGAMVLVTTFIGRILFSGRSSDAWIFSFFFMGALIVGEVGLTVWWLRTEARARGTEDV